MPLTLYITYFDFIMIGLLDCNNFYVSCERLFNPKLLGKPVVVLSNNDGCVISRSNEAKELGIKMGEPFFKIKNLIKKLEISVLSSNYSFYGDISDRIMSILRKNLPNTEVYSIDEAFFYLDIVTGRENFCFDLAKKILRWTGIPVSIGLAKTKTLAKISNRVIKKRKDYPDLSIDYHNVLETKSEKELNYILKNTDVEDVWGVGRGISSFLSNCGIRNALELKEINDSFAKKEKGIILQRTILELRGISCDNIKNDLKEKKSICVSRSFGKKLNLQDDIRSALIVYVQKASSKMRTHRLFCKTITIFLKTSKYCNKVYKNSESYSLLEATNDSRVIWKISDRLLKKIYRESFLYSKVGIILSDFCTGNNIQQNLISNRRRVEDLTDSNQDIKLMDAVDYINSRFGNGKLRISSDKNGFFYKKNKEVNWLMKSDYRSPCYTTNWCDIPKVKV